MGGICVNDNLRAQFELSVFFLAERRIMGMIQNGNLLLNIPRAVRGIWGFSKIVDTFWISHYEGLQFFEVYMWSLPLHSGVGGAARRTRSRKNPTKNDHTIIILIIETRKEVPLILGEMHLERTQLRWLPCGD